MGLIDSITDAANKGASAVGKTSQSMKLKMKQDELMKRRRELVAQLGANLYEITKDDPKFRSGREELYTMIEGLDAERERIVREMAELENAQQQPTSFTCSRCGSAVRSDDKFCSGCGRSADEIFEEAKAQASAAALVEPAPSIVPLECPNCHLPLAEDDVYCMRCGRKVAADDSSVTESESATGSKGPVEDPAV